MRCRFAFAFAFILAASPAQAVIKVLTPLKKVLAETETIFVAEVDKVDAEKPSVIFKFAENLKGKAPAEKFPVNLTGDSFAKKDEHTKVMLERLAPGRKLILFTQKIDKTYIAFGFLEGTWFQMRGTTDGDAIRWAFLHCEPYFRRTFKGTTDELKATISDGLAGKKEPPEPDEKEPHGFGPPAEKPKEEECTSGRAGSRQRPEFDDPKLRALTRPGSTSGFPLFGVIPSFVLVGPLAILSALFPTMFAGLAGGLKRWRAFMIVASVNSMFTGGLYLIALYFKLPDHWIFGPVAVAGIVLLNTLLGMAWAGLRYRFAAEADESITLPPRRNDFLAVLAFAGIVAVALLCIAYFFGSELVFKAPTREFTAIGVGLLVAAAYSAFRMATKGVGALSSTRLSIPGELVALTGVFAFTAILMIHGLPRSASRNVSVELGDATAESNAYSPKLIDATIIFESPEATQALSSLAVTQRRLFLGGSKQTAFANLGVLIAQDRTVDRKVWSYTAADMKPVYSTPTVVGKRLYVGEGLHTDTDCRLFCFDIETGKPIWTKTTKSHTEGAPVVAEDRVYFSAGDDGLYCVNAENGEDVWHFQGLEQNLHIDTTTVVANGKVYAGSGYNTFAALCLDAATGKPIWKKDLPLRSFGTPLLVGNQLILGLGTGNLSEDLSTEPEKGQPKESIPAGLLIALDATTGAELWKYELPRSAHTQLSHSGRTVYAACRDGWLYAIDRKTGKLLWRFSYGAPLTAGPVVASFANGEVPLAVYQVSSDGQVYCHSPHDGKVIWTRSIQDVTGRTANVMAAPTLWVSPDGVERTLYVPAQFKNRNNGQESVGVVRFVDKLGE